MSKKRERCQADVTAVKKAKAARHGLWFSKERAAGTKKVKAAKAKLDACLKKYTEAGGLLYTRGLARAAHDTGRKFPLKPDFKEKAKAFKTDDVARKALKVKKDSEIYGAAEKIGKKLGLDKAARYAATTAALQDTLKGTNVGFISAQIGLVLVDVLGTIVSLGAYAAAAPAVHAAVAGGQTVTTALIKKDIALNEQKYKAEIQKYKAKKELASQKKEAAKLEAETKKLEALEKKTEAAEKGTEVAPVAAKPWYTSTGVLIAGGFVVGLAVIAATKKSGRK